MNSLPRTAVRVSSWQDLMMSVTQQVPGVSQGWSNLHQDPRGQGAWSSSGDLEHPQVLAPSESRDGFHRTRFEKGTTWDTWPSEKTEAGSCRWTDTSVRACELMPSWRHSVPCAACAGRSRLGGGRVFLHLGAGETSPSMIFHLTSPCHICQLLLITEFAITLHTDVKGRKKRKRRLRDSTIINDVWQAKVPYNAL